MRTKTTKSNISEKGKKRIGLTIKIQKHIAKKHKILKKIKPQAHEKGEKITASQNTKTDNLNKGYRNIKVEREKEFIMWSGVTFFMILIIFCWAYNTKIVLQKISHESEQLPKIELNQMFEQISDKINEVEQKINLTEENTNIEIKENSLPTGGKKKEVSKKSIIKKILPKAAKGIVKKSEKSKKPIIKKITSKPKIGKEENKTEKIAVPVSKSEIVENKKTEKIIEGEKEVKEEPQREIPKESVVSRIVTERQQTNFGLVEPLSITKEMKQSYLDYAMSVIVQRALPDARDGMKPVHRRILYAMWNIGLRSNAKFRKSANVIGEVLGKYHPHGDTAVYDSMVRMAQDFSMRYPFVKGQGNFGSMDGDSPAAMRYTEAKMSAISEELLTDLDKNTVDFIPNYDGSQKEPSVFPAKLPGLLLNGTMGIAVGMATNIPPHNLSELIGAISHLIDNPEARIEDLMEFLKGPDFPTGGMIYNKKDILQAYSTGRGGIVMRGKADIEESKSGKFKIIISEVPYQLNKATLVEKIAELVKDKKLDGIRDLRDESDKDGVRVVLELKKDSYPKKILNSLYKLTQLQQTFHVNMLFLVEGIHPKVQTKKGARGKNTNQRKGEIKKKTKFGFK